MHRLGEFGCLLAAMSIKNGKEYVFDNTCKVSSIYFLPSGFFFKFAKTVTSHIDIRVLYFLISCNNELLWHIVPATGHITNNIYQQELVRVTHYIINNTYTHFWPQLISKLLVTLTCLQCFFWLASRFTLQVFA